VAQLYRKSKRTRGSKTSSIGVGGRGRRVKIGTSTMNKDKKRQLNKYRGQGR
tara:strand:- start:672 stop:827 length:156 start_codon:yes stop_codon:yes gene_type:complete